MAQPAGYGAPARYGAASPYGASFSSTTSGPVNSAPAALPCRAGHGYGPQGVGGVSGSSNNSSSSSNSSGSGSSSSSSSSSSKKRQRTWEDRKGGTGTGAGRKKGAGQGAGATRKPQKKRFAWSDTLHGVFVESLYQLGLKCAQPQVLLELMPKHDDDDDEEEGDEEEGNAGALGSSSGGTGGKLGKQQQHQEIKYQRQRLNASHIKSHLQQCRASRHKPKEESPRGVDVSGRGGGGMGGGVCRHGNGPSPHVGALCRACGVRPVEMKHPRGGGGGHGTGCYVASGPKRSEAGSGPPSGANGLALGAGSDECARKNGLESNTESHTGHGDGDRVNGVYSGVGVHDDCGGVGCQRVGELALQLSGFVAKTTEHKLYLAAVEESLSDQRMLLGALLQQAVREEEEGKGGRRGGSKAIVGKSYVGSTSQGQKQQNIPRVLPAPVPSSSSSAAEAGDHCMGQGMAPPPERQHYSLSQAQQPLSQQQLVIHQQQQQQQQHQQQQQQHPRRGPCQQAPRPRNGSGGEFSSGSFSELLLAAATPTDSLRETLRSAGPSGICATPLKQPPPCIAASPGYASPSSEASVGSGQSGLGGAAQRGGWTPQPQSPHRSLDDFDSDLWTPSSELDEGADTFFSWLDPASTAQSVDMGDWAH